MITSSCGDTFRIILASLGGALTGHKAIDVEIWFFASLYKLLNIIRFVDDLRRRKAHLTLL